MSQRLARVAYRGARSIPAALEELRANAGTQFCAKVVAALDDLWREHPEVLGAGRLRAVGKSA